MKQIAVGPDAENIQRAAGRVALRWATVTGNHTPRGTCEATRPLAVDRYRSIVDVYVLMQRPDGMILLLQIPATPY